jgi:hypothetical protein
VSVHEMAVACPARDPQHARYCAPTRKQDGADQQGLSVPPGAVDEQWRKRQVIPAKRAGRCSMRRLWRGTPSAYPLRPLRHPARSATCQNGQSRAEAPQMANGQSMRTGSKHIEQTMEAHIPYNSRSLLTRNRSPRRTCNADHRHRANGPITP